MKKCSVIILAALFVASAGLPVRGFAQDPSAEAWAEYQRQAQEEAELKKEAWAKYQKDQDAEAKRKEESWAKWDEQMNKDQDLQARFEKIIVKWEEQAARYDRVLEAMEKQFGVEKDN